MVINLKTARMDEEKTIPKYAEILKRKGFEVKIETHDYIPIVVFEIKTLEDLIKVYQAFPHNDLIIEGLTKDKMILRVYDYWIE